ncbi:MAG: nucleotidyltransferase [Verrucomicrobia bacterium]|nr:nucleotidyltransferase [Verrucomicrobiota bacterium]
MILNEDYRDILFALNAEQVDFILVGAYALAAHGFPRATMDIDIWVMPSPENADAVIRALKRFGSPLHDLKAEDLQNTDTVFQIGVAPRRIDLLTGATGLDFPTAAENAIVRQIDGIDLKVLSIDDLIVNKLATGRPKDQIDADELKKLKGES